MAKQMLSINLGVEGEKRLRAVLQVSIDAIDDMDPAWQRIRDDFAEEEKDWLDSEGRGSFRRLSPAYAARKAAKYGNKPILQRSGRLRASLTDPNDRDFVYRAERLRVVLGTKVRYARYHQKGTRTMPRRPPVRMGRDAGKRWSRIIHEHLFETGQFQRAPRVPLLRGRRRRRA